MAQTSFPIKNLFVDSVQMTIARYPNTGFLYIESVNGTTQFTAQGIDREPNYWIGATARIRTTNYTFEMRTIASYNGTTITLQSGTAYLRVGYGFYLDNKLSELDAPGEWYFDTLTNKIYFYPPGGVDPNTLNIYGSCLDYGVASSQSNITIRNIAFSYQIQSAIRFSGTTNNVQILSNDLIYGLVNGIQVDGISSRYTINGNKLTGFNGRGIVFANTTQTTISDNIIKNIGLVQGYGFSGVNGMTGIVLARGSNNIISVNNLDSIGYIGIRCDGSYNLVEKNIIRNCMLMLNDGGALYAYSESPSITFGTVWRHNIIDNVVGNIEGYPSGNAYFVVGIYMDHQAINMRIEKNTVMNSSNQGIFLQYNTYHDTLYHNITYNCGGKSDGHALFFWLDSTNGRGYGNHVIVGNVFMASDSGMPSPVQVMNRNINLLSPGILDSNYFCTPAYGSAVSLLTFDTVWHRRDYTIEQWRNLSSRDQNSKVVRLNVCPLLDTVINAEELISHGKFDIAGDVSYWFDWSSNTRRSWVADAGLDGGCLKYNSTKGGPLGTRILGGVNSEQWYKLEFSTIAPMDGLCTVGFRQYHSPYSLISYGLKMPIGPLRKDYVCFMKAFSDDTLTALDFRTQYEDSIFYIDNVSLHKMEGRYIPTLEKTPIYVNSTSEPMVVNLGSESYFDLDGNTVSGSFVLAPYSSKILVRNYAGTEPNNVLSTEMPQRFILHQNYPNPFNPTTTINYELAIRTKVCLKIYDILGREITTLVNGIEEAGVKSVQWNADIYPSGVYFYRLQAANYIETKKLLLLR